MEAARFGLTADLADRPTPPTPPTAKTQYRNGSNFVTPQVSSPTADHPREVGPQPKWGIFTDEHSTPVTAAGARNRHWQRPGHVAAVTDLTVSPVTKLSVTVSAVTGGS